MRGVCLENPDPSHDILHVARVVNWAKILGKEEGADLNIVVPAAYLHDCVHISKTDERRAQASRISADRAVELLREWKYPERHWTEIHHAIVAHSFSAGIPAETIEAKVVQDADRLDAMGAVGIFRCFAFSGLAGRPLYFFEDPFCEVREPDDSTNTLDHFFVKLLHLQDRLHTNAAKSEGEKRLRVMKDFIDKLRSEI
ncbi:MAG: HD domain-containing protein [Bdellovibrionales bacterium]|nr:HD domain-containing protein [Bdellovibrionales bacterium]